ncbi:DMT family transporter [Ornithinibacillus gellani]|uniref:DMT family transporter n=1 Tax=Ornithinibacillus gellani TaxID=2293253 RepID=UPI000F47F618|nr:DMT family transporter [Ornithinibacillus gellani]TQS76422.1 DMT family transporter [Ornithinibacillus gellani]
MRLPPINPYFVIVIGSISVSSSAILVKLAAGTPAAMIANYRLVFAVLFMLPIVLLKYRHELKLIQRKDWIFSTLAGIFLAFHFILWFESLNYTSVASSVVLVSLQPIFAFLGTYLFFQERFSPAALISMIIALLGSIIISWGDLQMSGVALFGDILALLGAVMITIYFLLGQSVRKRLSIMTYTFVIYSIAAIVLIAYNIILSNPFIGFPTSHWWIFIALAIIPTFLGHTLFNWALKWLSTATISMGIIFEPVGASILAYFILGEKISYSQWLGGSVVLFGLFLFTMGTARKRNVTISKKIK